LNKFAADGHIDAKEADAKRRSGLLADSGIASLPGTATRFCRHELGPDVVLSGTGNRGL
jgi:hypothetical protein